MQVGPTLGHTLGPTLDALDAARGVVPRQGPTATSTSARTETFTVKLGYWTYPLAWVGIYLIHAACAAHCFASAMMFTKLQTTLTAYYLDFYQVTLPSKHAHTVSVVHYIVGGVHCYFLLMAFLRAFYRVVRRIVKRCRRTAAVVQPKHRTSSTFLDRVSAVGSQTIERRVPLVLRRPVLAVYTHIFGRRGVLGVEYRYFDAFFLVREITETALQSFQAYQMCRLLVRPALNRFFVGTLVINCWATPVLHHLVRSKPMQRLLTRLCDVVLDFLASVGVPMILALSYVDDYDPVTKDFPYRLWYDDIWFVNALKESPIILFSSWLDAVSRLVFSIGVLSSLDDIKMLLKRGPGFQFSKAAASLRRMTTTKLSGKTKIRAPRRPPPRSWYNPHRSRIVTVAHRLMFTYGVLVLAVHLHAELRPSPMSSCLLEVRPWLVSKPACSLVEVNCWRDRTLTGDAIDFDHNVGNLDALSLTQITFRHCHQIEMQPSIERFQNMIGVKFYNSTIASWEDAAAFRERNHAAMRFAFFVRTNLPNGTLPAGMLSHEFPLLLNDLEFSVTNIHWIPDDLDARWPPGVALCLEFSELTTYPMTFARAHFQSLTLSGNKITSFPAAAFEAPGPFMIGLTGNPITELPTDVNASRVALRRFSFDSTNVSSVPPWVPVWIERVITKHKITAGRTPFCRDVVLKATPSELAAQPWLARVDCKDKGPTFGIYPHYVDERADEVW